MIQGVAEEVETRDGRVEGQVTYICIRHKEYLASHLGMVNAARIAYLLKRKARRAIMRTAGFDGGLFCDQLGDALFSDFDLLVSRKTDQGTRPDCHRRPLRRPVQN